MTIPNATIKYGLGVTYVNQSSTYNPLKGMWINNADGTWHPVKTGWVCHNDGTWERIYPTPRGVLTPNISAISLSTYQYYQAPTPFTFSITNTGDYDLTINGATISDSTGNYITTAFQIDLPQTLAPSNSINITTNVYGNTVGSFTGNITFNNYIGYLGSTNNTIPVSITVNPDYSALSTVPTNYSFTSYVLDSPPSTSFTVTNTGNGGNLIISNIASAKGLITISGISFPTTVGGIFTHNGFNSTFVGNSTTFTATTANLAAGTYSDNIVISSNAETTIIPINITIIQPNGLQAFTTPGTYTFTVPPHVHRLQVLSVGAGGGGGAALANGINPFISGYTNQGGGGGGGGSGGYNLQTISVTPGDVLTVTVADAGDPGAYNNAQYYPVSLSYAWGSFMNTYAVWTYPDGVNPVGRTVSSRRLFSAPYSGNYYIEYSADNYVTIYIDDVEIASSSNDTTFTSSAIVTVNINQGNRILTFNSLNTGGPAGFAATIRDTSNNLLWSTRTDLNSWSGTNGASTSVSGTFGSVNASGGAPGDGAYDDYVSPVAYDYGSGGDGGNGGC